MTYAFNSDALWLTLTVELPPVISFMCMRMKTWSVPNVPFCYCERRWENALQRQSSTGPSRMFSIKFKVLFQARSLLAFYSNNPYAPLHHLIILCTFSARLSYELQGLAPAVSLTSPTSPLCSTHCSHQGKFSSQVLSGGLCPGYALCLEWPLIAITSTLKCHLLSKTSWSSMRQRFFVCFVHCCILCTLNSTWHKIGT